jgi:hypothetical protein
LARTFDRSEGVTAVHEPEPLTAALNIDAAGGSSAVEGLRSLRSITGEGVYLESGAFLGFLAEDLVEAFPGARFLHVHRDPRAFVASALATWFPPQEHHSWWPEIPLDSPPLRMIWWWNAVNRAGVEALRNFGPGAVLRVGTEELWHGGGVGRVAEWLGVPPPPPSVPVNSRLGQAEWDPAWEGFLADHAGEVMDELGYH